MIPILSDSPEKSLCLINIAGGAASDSINSLILILQQDPSLLQNRKIEINVLDIDYFGPAFADRCISSLKNTGGQFNGLNISFRHIHYDWNNTDILLKLLSERSEWIKICSSEGGLFEYCQDDVIIKNLNVLHKSSPEVVVLGSLLHNINKIDAGTVAALKISTSIKPRFLGLEGLKMLCENKWTIEGIIEGNPRYLVFCRYFIIKKIL
jgi:hypothetical protein